MVAVPPAPKRSGKATTVLLLIMAMATLEQLSGIVEAQGEQIAKLQEELNTVNNTLREADQYVRTQSNRINELEAKLAQQGVQVSAVEVRAIQTEQNLTRVEGDLRDGKYSTGAAGAGGGNGLSIIDTRLIGKPKDFQGTQEKWPSWSFTFKAYCGAVSHDMSELMKSVVLTNIEVAMGGLTAVQEQFSKFLYYMIVMLVVEGSPAYAKVRGCPEGNGLEAWRRFHAEFEPQVRGRFQSMLQGLMAAKFGTVALQNISSELENFERECVRYEDQPKQRIPSERI